MKKILLLSFGLTVLMNAYSQSRPPLYQPNNGDSIAIAPMVGGAIRTVYMKDILKQRTLFFNNVAAMVAAANPLDSAIILLSGYYTKGDGGGGRYYYSAASTATADGGSVIAPSNNTGRYIALWDEGVVNVKRFGAKSDLSSAAPYSGTNNTLFFQKALNYANSNIKQRYKVVVPPGQFGLDTLNMYAGMMLEGMGGFIEQIGRAQTKLYQFRNVNRDFIRCFDTLSGGVNRGYWYGAIRNLELCGDSLNNIGHGISVRDPNGFPHAMQDVSEFAYLTVRYFPEGGIELPDNGTPAMVHDIKLGYNGGKTNFHGGIRVGARNTGSTGQTISLRNISGDGNAGGVIVLDSLNAGTNVMIDNLKAEAREGNPFMLRNGSTVTYCQEIPITINQCDSTVIVIHGASNISSVDSAGVFKKPGSMVQITGTKTPFLRWDGLGFRLRTTDLGADPTIINGVSLFTYRTSYGNYPYNSVSLSKNAFLEVNRNADQDVNKEVGRFWFDNTNNTVNVGTNFFGTGTFVRPLKLYVQPTVNSTALTNAKVLTISQSPNGALGIFNFDGSSTGLSGSTASYNGTLNGSTTTQSIVGYYNTINQTSTASANVIYVAPFLQGLGSGEHNIFKLGTSSAASNGGTFTPAHLLDFWGNAYYAGKLSINTSDSATAYLNLPAGTATLAPLKMHSATLTTTPLSGYIENDGTRPYYTNSSNARTGMALLSDISSSTSKATDYLSMYNTMGSAIKAQSIPVEDMTGTVALATGQVRVFRVPVPVAATLTGIRWFQTTQGVYTANNENRIGFYTLDPATGTLTLVASTADDGTMWSTPTAGSYANKDFTTPYNAGAGVYFAVMLYNTSAQTTAPSIGAKSVTNANAFVLDFPNSIRLSGLKSSTTTLPATLAMSAITSTTALPYLEVY